MLPYRRTPVMVSRPLIALRVREMTSMAHFLLVVRNYLYAELTGFVFGVLPFSPSLR